MYSPNVILAPVTAGGTSLVFYNQGSPVTIVSTGLQTVETATVQIFDEATQAWVNLILESVVQALDLNTNAIQISAQGKYRVVKTASAALVGVTMQ